SCAQPSSAGYGVTVRAAAVVCMMGPDLAPIIVTPADTPVARPKALMVATAGIEELQATKLVMSCGPLVKVPVAVNCCVWLTRIEADRGLIAMDIRPTVKPVLPVMVPETAWMVVPPSARPVANPATSMVATAGAEEPQATNTVTSRGTESAKVPVAVNCCVPL